MRALIDIHRHEGWLPDARKGNFNGITQGGTNADVMIADALARGLTGIDWQAAYAAVKADAETVSPDPLRFGRRGLEDWKRLGYVAVEGNDVTGSRQVEYALDDWCVAQLAKRVGRTADYRTYAARSGNWRNLFDRTFESEGFKGFIRPRHRDGTWVAPFVPTASAGTGGPGFYEDGSWAYSFFVPHDVPALIETMGGRDEFIRRLDHFFAVPGRYYTGNEPAFMIPYLYLWTGRHDRTAHQIRRTLAAEFDDTRSGLPGNDDSGAMSAWYVEGLIGPLSERRIGPLGDRIADVAEGHARVGWWPGIRHRSADASAGFDLCRRRDTQRPSTRSGVAAASGNRAGRGAAVDDVRNAGCMAARARPAISCHLYKIYWSEYCLKSRTIA